MPREEVVWAMWEMWFGVWCIGHGRLGLRVIYGRGLGFLFDGKGTLGGAFVEAGFDDVWSGCCLLRGVRCITSNSSGHSTA